MPSVGDSQIILAQAGDYPCAGCPDVCIDDEQCVNEGSCRAWKIYMGDNR